MRHNDRKNQNMAGLRKNSNFIGAEKDNIGLSKKCLGDFEDLDRILAIRYRISIKEQMKVGLSTFLEKPDPPSAAGCFVITS